MKLYTIIYLVLLLIIFASDYLLIKRTPKSNKIKKHLHLTTGILFAVYYTLLKIFSEQITDYRILIIVMWINLLFILIYIPKLLYLLISRFPVNGIKNSLYHKTIALIMIFTYVSVIIYGTLVTPNQIEVTRSTLKFNSLPKSFNDFKIVQISDIHLGSRLNGQSFYKSVIDTINFQKPDMIVFTGDMVNNFANEMNGYEHIFSKLKSNFGKFAILGNHDYGDYSVWQNSNAKAENFNQIKSNINKFGFRLLLNEHLSIKKQTDSLELIGVENYSNNANKNYANLKMAIRGVNPYSFKVLLSHNPNHWEEVILKTKFPIELTLSGHTHAGQAGFKVNSKVYSPVWFLYKLYQGVYSENEQYLHVSRGLGFIGLPLMLGLKPEISIITIQTK